MPFAKKTAWLTVLLYTTTTLSYALEFDPRICPVQAPWEYPPHPTTEALYLVETQHTECPAHATCMDTVLGLRGVCNKGYTGHWTECRDINECVDMPCGLNAKCTNTPGSFTCECKHGWEGDGFTCRRIFEEIFFQSDQELRGSELWVMKGASSTDHLNRAGESIGEGIRNVIFSTRSDKEWNDTMDRLEQAGESIAVGLFKEFGNTVWWSLFKLFVLLLTFGMLIERLQRRIHQGMLRNREIHARDTQPLGQQIAKAEEDEETDADKDQCIICMTNKKRYAVFPCGHMAFCSECHSGVKGKLDKCPVCREKTVTTRRIYT